MIICLGLHPIYHPAPARISEIIGGFPRFAPGLYAISPARQPACGLVSGLRVKPLILLISSRFAGLRLIVPRRVPSRSRNPPLRNSFMTSSKARLGTCVRLSRASNATETLPHLPCLLSLSRTWTASRDKLGTCAV